MRHAVVAEPAGDAEPVRPLPARLDEWRLECARISRHRVLELVGVSPHDDVADLDRDRVTFVPELADRHDHRVRSLRRRMLCDRLSGWSAAGMPGIAVRDGRPRRRTWRVTAERERHRVLEAPARVRTA